MLILLTITTTITASCLLLNVDAGVPDNNDNNNYNNIKIIPDWQLILSDVATTTTTTTTTEDNHSLLLKNWTLQSNDGIYKNLSNVVVPGDLLSDLMYNNLIDDPYYDLNFLKQRHVWMGEDNDDDDNYYSERIRTRTWIYSTFIPPPPPSTTSHRRILVLSGIKMGASVYYRSTTATNSTSTSTNNKRIFLGNVTNQFLTYLFEIPTTTSTSLRLEIIFDPTIKTNGRFMACSGGWDWAPYTREICNDNDNNGIITKAFTLGLTKPISIIPIHTTYIRHVIPKIYPLSIMNHNIGNFHVKVEIILETLLPKTRSSTITPMNVPQTLYIYSEWNNSTIETKTTIIQQQQDEMNSNEANTIMIQSTSIIVELDANNVELWWPKNGVGSQKLYNLRISFDQITWIERKIGFRSIALISTTTNSTTTIEDEGTGSNGMIIAINNKHIWCRGANVVPLDQLEGRVSDEAYVRMVQSAAKANMNMIRIWGGGTILPKSFYDACDKYGILLYHDLMFVAQREHGVTHETDIVRHEIMDIVRKLSSHPSIIIWSGCNECTYFTPDITIYAKFVLTTVVQTDDTRIVWPSCPSKYGWKAGVRTMDGLPNGKPLELYPTNRTGHNIEKHGPYQRGISETYPTINGQVANNTYETLIPPTFFENDHHPTTIGVQHQNTFISEFGASVFSSFESMSVTLQEKDWGIHGSGPPDNCTMKENGEKSCMGTNVMAERNYACDSRIEAFFGKNVMPSLNEIGPKAFQRQLYQCMVSQTIWMKGQIEQIRSENVFGTLIWQLNENFPTGGWGVVEYGPSRGLKQQIVGGRWKPIMYLLSNILFRDVIVACGKGGECFARNDGMKEESVEIMIEAWDLTKRDPLRNHSLSIQLEAGPGQMHRFQLSDDFYNDDDVDLVILTYDGNVESVVLWKIPALLPSFGGTVHVNVTKDATTSMGASVHLESDYLALYVVLSTNVDGVFADNSFLLRPGIPKTVRFDPISKEDDPIDVDALRKSLRVATLCDYCGLNYLERESAIVSSG